MNNKPLSKKIKSILRQLLSRFSLLKRLFILLYKLSGRRPWSLGYSIYKYNFVQEIIDKHLSIFNDKQLSINYGFKMDERVVEYPWFFSRLKDGEAIILDAGSALNYWEMFNLACLRDRKLYLTTLSNEGLKNTKNDFSYVYEDLRSMCYKNDFFDAVACISTLEHVGMDNTFLYTRDKTKNENIKYGYLEAIREFKRVLKRGGTLYLTVPYGRYRDHKWLQVFDDQMVRRIIEEFSPSKTFEFYFKYEHNQWNFSDAESCKDGYYFDIHNERVYSQNCPAASQSVICLELSK